MPSVPGAVHDAQPVIADRAHYSPLARVLAA